MPRNERSVLEAMREIASPPRRKTPKLRWPARLSVFLIRPVTRRALWVTPESPLEILDTTRRSKSLTRWAYVCRGIPYTGSYNPCRSTPWGSSFLEKRAMAPPIRPSAKAPSSTSAKNIEKWERVTHPCFTRICQVFQRRFLTIFFPSSDLSA